MGYVIHLGILISLYAILGMALNLVMGETGLLSVMQAAFYGIGAYVAAIAMTAHGINFFGAMLFGVIVSGIVSLAIGAVLSKFNGDYFAFGSLGFHAIVFACIVNIPSLTGGAIGIPGIPRPSAFGFTFSSNGSFLILTLVCAVIVYGLCEWITHASFGRVLKAIREDEKVAEIFGYKVRHYKLTIFVIGAMVAAVAGTLYAGYFRYIDPSSFNLNESIFILSLVVLGGLGSTRGAILGAAFLVLLPEALQFIGISSDVIPEIRQIIYGLMLAFLMLYRPQGLMGDYAP